MNYITNKSFQFFNLYKRKCNKHFIGYNIYQPCNPMAAYYARTNASSYGMPLGLLSRL